MKSYIYGLSGSDGIIRYVGKSIRPSIRKLEHIYEAKSNKTNPYKNSWIINLLDSGDELLVHILDICDENNWQEKEIYWISQFENLTNISHGGDGCSGAKYILTLDEVKEWVRSNLPKMRVEQDWRDYIKDNILPNFIPYRPDYVYKDRGWISYRNFFGFDIVTYEELKNIILNNNIRTKEEYWSFRDISMPYHPYNFYDEWVSWFELFKENLGKNPINKVRVVRKRVKNNKMFFSYEEAKKIIKNLLFTKKKEYVNWVKNNKKFEIDGKIIFMPSCPYDMYDEWVSWEDFFDNGLPKIINYVGGKKWEHFLSYLDAKKWVNDNYAHIKNEYNWRGITKELPKFIPKRPDVIYKGIGWSGMKDFLNKK